MELHEWLTVYQAASVTAASKERAYWSLVGTCLIASAILLVVGSVMGMCALDGTYSGYTDPGLSALTSGLAVLGALISAYWLAMGHRMSREVAHWHGLLRQLEGEFAGAEFHRSALRLLKGQPVRTPMITPHFEDWYPGAMRLSWLPRALAGLAAVLLPAALLAAWIALSILPWAVPLP